MIERATAALALAIAASACAVDASVPAEPSEFPWAGGPKSDALGRGLVGIASDYEPAELDAEALRSNMRLRREAAWRTVYQVLEPVPLLGLAEDAEEHDEIDLPEGEMPMVARWQTWYGITDLARMFGQLYEELTPAERAVRVRFSDAALEEAFEWNAGALDRSTRWPLERYFEYLRSLGICPDDIDDDQCAALVESRFGGAASGNARILYSPAVAMHVLRQYDGVLECLTTLESLKVTAKPQQPANFTACFDTELDPSSVLVKAQWIRADFGRGIPAFDTDGNSMRTRFSQTSQWNEDGNREQQPSPGDIFTIRLRNGDTYRLAGLHIMTKELRHWQWVTLWWSDRPATDFGADRPDNFAELPGVWSNYKMCVVGSFAEGDANAAGRFADLPTLADALDATGEGGSGSTWCSNPYIEHGRNNARTNCVGCHQHGGATVAYDIDEDGILDPLDLDAVLENELRFPDRGRRQVREIFPADYLYSFNRVDDFAHVIEAEVGFFDGVDRDSVAARTDRILEIDATDPVAGSETYSQRCAACHGDDGSGSAFAPNLSERVPDIDDRLLLQSLIAGRGGMPAWGEKLSDQGLADVRAHLRESFAATD